MGDADSEVIVPVQEIEAWMDEALEVVDEGMEHLFTFMKSLNERTRQVILQMKKVENFRRCFLSLNVLIVPVVLAIIMCYAARESIGDHSSDFETGFQLIVSLLMFISGGIGFPLYLYSLWESFCLAEIIRKEYENSRLPNSQRFQNAYNIDGESLFTLVSQDLSMERLNDFARMLSNRMPDRMRSEMDQRYNPLQSERRNDYAGIGTRSLERRNVSSSEWLAVNPKLETSSIKNSLPESNDADTPKANYERAKADESFPIVYEVQVRLHEKSPDLSIKIEPTTEDEGKDKTRPEVHGEKDKDTFQEFDHLKDSSQEDTVEQEDIEKYEVPSENPYLVN